MPYTGLGNPEKCSLRRGSLFVMGEEGVVFGFHSSGERPGLPPPDRRMISSEPFRRTYYPPVLGPASPFFASSFTYRLRRESSFQCRYALKVRLFFRSPPRLALRRGGFEQPPFLLQFGAVGRKMFKLFLTWRLKDSLTSFILSRTVIRARTLPSAPEVSVLSLPGRTIAPPDGGEFTALRSAYLPAPFVSSARLTP